MLYRTGMILANLRGTKGPIKKSDAYCALDPSEKAAASYFIGLTLSNLMARRLFGIRWLLHLDVYHDTLRPSLRGSGRPDLVGSDRMGRWYVIEAKGRSNGLDKHVIAHAKTQTRKLRTICGHSPHLRVASVAHFTGGSLSVHMEDPHEVDDDALDWDIPENQFLQDYYRLFVAIIAPNDRIRRRRPVAPESEIS